MGTQKFFVIAATGTHAAIDLHAMNDKRLTWKAKALHYYIRTRGEITTNQDALVAAGPEGRDAVNNGVKELIQRKYLYLTQVREGGRFKYAAYISFPKPVELNMEQLQRFVETGRLDVPYTAFPYTGNPLHGAELPGVVSYTRKPEISTPKGVPISLSFLGDDAVARRIEEVFSHWNEEPALPTHRRGTQFKTYQQCVAAIHKALQKHDTMFIKQAITNYNMLLEEPYTVIRGKDAPDRVGLNEFFEWRKFSLDIIAKHKPHLQHAVSWFDECRKGRDYLMNKYGARRKDKYPAVSNAIITALKSEGIVLTEPTTSDINVIRAAAERVVDFHTKHKNELPARMGQPDLARELVNCIEGAKHAGYLITDITWSGFERYLAENGILERRLNWEGLRAETGASL